MSIKNTVDIISMGCSKNLVDSERLIRMFEDAGMHVRHNPETLKSPLVIINTCGFICDAKEESIDMILQACRAKAEGLVDKVIVMGCLSQRYARDLPKEIPDVDKWYGKYDWTAIVSDLKKSLPRKQSAPWQRTLTTPAHSAYLKVAEGCNRFCAFCAIPLITGRYHSRPIEEVVEEVKDLVKRGVKEFNVIAQDLTYYGKDICQKPSIAALVEAIAKEPGVEWIRLHYAYPNDFPMDLLDVMDRCPNVCRYLDIALQHISDKVLANMQRHITGAQTKALLAKIRERVPGIHIRTTLMVGFPGEGDKEFAELLDFVREQRFERMGAFAYCEEEDTYAAKHFADDIPEEVKQKRLEQIMSMQEEISLEHNEKKVGQTIKVIIDREDEDYYVGRSQFDSPEVDPEILINKSKKMETGRFYDVKITEAYPFELMGEAVCEK